MPDLHPLAGLVYHRRMQRDLDTVLEAARRLAPDERKALVEILRAELAVSSRKALCAEIAAGREEFARGKCVCVQCLDELKRDITS